MDTIIILSEWVKLRNLSMQQIKERCSISDSQIRQNSSYIKLTNLTALHNPAQFPGTFYFRDGIFVLLYVGTGPELNQFDRKTLWDYLGGQGVKLQSRVEKRAVHHVYPELGIAFSADPESVSILEIFPPMTIEQYQATIYRDPGLFIK